MATYPIVKLMGVAMGSQVGPILGNSFLCYYKTIWLKRRPKKFRPKYYKRFMDDISVIFGKTEHLQQFTEYVIKKNSNFRISVEAEKNEALSFLDFKIYRENRRNITNMYRK